MQGDDSDIDAMLRGQAVPPPVPRHVRRERVRRSVVPPPVEPVDATGDTVAVAELSAELVEQLKRNSRPQPMTSAEYAAAVAKHLVVAPGLTGPAERLDVSPDEYHELPGFSSTTGKTLISQSPAHARSEHRWFGGRGRDPTKLMDRGNVVHALTLGKGKAFRVVDARDWKTNRARAERDDARAAGLVPILRHELDAAEVIADEIKRQLPDHGVRLDGESEVAIGWWEETEHGFVRCRSMLDHVHVDAGVILDVKVVDSVATTESVERSAENMGYALQEATYRRALSRLRPKLAGRIDMLFAFCEAHPPYAVNVCRGDGMFRELGERRWDRAVAIWARCLATNQWPAHGAGVNPLSVPMWALRREGLIDS